MHCGHVLDAARPLLCVFERFLFVPDVFGATITTKLPRTPLGMARRTHQLAISITFVGGFGLCSLCELVRLLCFADFTRLRLATHLVGAIRVHAAF